MSILAALDPGSARAALVIAEVDRPRARLLHHVVFPVGHLELLPAPKVTVSKAGKTWTRTHKRVLDPAEEDALVTEIVSLLLSHGVQRLLIEASAPYLAEGAPLAAMRAQVREIATATGIAKRIQDRLGLLGVAVDLVPRVTWLAALRRHAAAGLTPGVTLIPQAVGKAGAPLDPLLRAHLPELYARPAEPDAIEGPLPEDGGEAQEESDAPEAEAPARERARSPGADVRDAAGLLLSAVLECPPPGRAARVRPVASGASPATPRAPRPPGTPERVKAREKALRAAKRAIIGCTCPPGGGRPRASCAVWAVHQAASAARTVGRLEEARARRAEMEADKHARRAAAGLYLPGWTPPEKP